jgi:XTP/dITP diphosphohydrolase
MNSNAKLDLLIATHNPGKIIEVKEALRSLPVRLRYLREFTVRPVDEVGRTYEENAVLKALSYAEQTGLCALADDSGLEVDALNGRPGVHSARFGGDDVTDVDRTRKLLLEISQNGGSDRNACFVCCMAFSAFQPSNDGGAETPYVLTVVEAKCVGSISDQPLGTNGFGFDPVFVPAGYHATFAALPKEVKARISHRAQALAAIEAFLTHWFAQT